MIYVEIVTAACYQLLALLFMLKTDVFLSVNIHNGEKS